MTFAIYETSPAGTRYTVAVCATFKAAERKIQKIGVIHYERDADYPGCADAMMKDGRVLSVGPIA